MKPLSAPDTDRAESFAPLLCPAPRVLILGSSPGRVSLRLQQYYGNRRNAFWPIIARLLGLAEAPATWPERKAMLRRAQIALWDVLACCRRPGSLDSDIDPESEVPNDIPGLLRRHPGIRLIGCNGGKATAAFRRHVLPALSPAQRQAVRLCPLPSTSPANARMTPEQKYQIWRQRLALQDLPPTSEPTACA